MQRESRVRERTVFNSTQVKKKIFKKGPKKLTQAYCYLLSIAKLEIITQKGLGHKSHYKGEWVL